MAEVAGLPEMMPQGTESSQADEASRSVKENNDVPVDLPLEARLEKADQLLSL